MNSPPLSTAQYQLFSLLPPDQEIPTGHASVLHLLASLDEEDPFWGIYAAKKPKIPNWAWQKKDRTGHTALQVALKYGRLTAAAHFIQWGANPWAEPPQKAEPGVGWDKSNFDLDHLRLLRDPGDIDKSYQGLCYLFQSLETTPHRTTEKVSIWLGRFYRDNPDLQDFQWIRRCGLGDLVAHHLWGAPAPTPWQHWIPGWGVTPLQDLGGGATWVENALKTNDLDSLRWMVKAGKIDAIWHVLAKKGLSGSSPPQDWVKWVASRAEQWSVVESQEYNMGLLWSLIPEKVRSSSWVPTHSESTQFWRDLMILEGDSLPLQITFWEDVAPERWTNSSSPSHSVGKWLIGMMDMGWPRAVEAAKCWVEATCKNDGRIDMDITMLSILLDRQGSWPLLFETPDLAINWALKKNWLYLATWMAKTGRLNLLDGVQMRDWQDRIRDAKENGIIYPEEMIERVRSELMGYFVKQEKDFLSHPLGSTSLARETKRRI